MWQGVNKKPETLCAWYQGVVRVKIKNRQGVEGVRKRMFELNLRDSR